MELASIAKRRSLLFTASCPPKVEAVFVYKGHPMRRRYDLRKIYTLLVQGFTEDELRHVCEQRAIRLQ